MNDADFLAAIRAAPQDGAARLVYADWLEEQGDSRAELIRIEEKLRQLPVFADEYWDLRPRSEELRARATPDWLDALGYGRWRPIFRHGVPDGWKERWRIIRAFTDVWFGIPLDDVGYREVEIRKTEERLGRALPPSVREWVAFAHDAGTRYQNAILLLRDQYMMEEMKGHAAVSLLLQGEGDYHWAVRHEHLWLPDPPVYGFHWDFDNPNVAEIENTFVQDQRSPLYPSVSEFALRYTLSNTRAAGGGFATRVADPSRLLRDLESSFPIRSRFGRREVSEVETEIFEAENILVEVSASTARQEHYLKVEVLRPLPREAVPNFLWDYARGGGSFHGMFIHESRVSGK
jgi:uncharacterized protein (TIGR02996 family)